MEQNIMLTYVYQQVELW